MTKLAFWLPVLKKNYHQVLLVFAAFIIVVLTGYFSVRGILSNRLLINAADSLSTAEANVRFAFIQSEVTLFNALHNVLNLIETGASQDDILAYLKRTTRWISESKDEMAGIYGIYGFIRGELIDGIEMNPGPDYVPQTRPWYQAAARSGNDVAYTPPYTDARTGNTIISAVKNIVDGSGEIHGILVVDMDITWIGEYAKNLRLAPGGYGMILSQYMTVMFHPDESILGVQLRELGGGFANIARRLRLEEEISGEEIKNYQGRRMIAFYRPIYNGWYLGLLIPRASFYRDLTNAAVILVTIGFVMALLLSFVLLRISAAKMKADEESRSKTTFLARMSHEIRTPMNAIIGMSELALREELPAKGREYVDNVRRAGNNLLSLINDILDFSKIESGRLEIINAEYRLASVLNDVVSIIRMRLDEKTLLFVTRIDGSLPGTLYGDEARLRQILLNLLSNAIKYTKEGSVTLTVHGENMGTNPEGKTWIKLFFEIADTGIGIKPENMVKLFGEFQQFDAKNNRGIEGTGLGLAITKNLCRLMGGDITVQSVYGQGSVFTAWAPQVVRGDTPFALVEQPETKSVLVYENRPAYAQSVMYTIENLKVDCALVHTHADFLERLNNAGWRFVITSPGLCGEVEAVLRERRLPAALVLLTGPGEAAPPGKPVLAMPVLPVQAADILNGKTGAALSPQTENAAGHYTAPDARILIVDDIASNIEISSGLLAPWEMKIDRAASGLEAVSLVRKNQYDLVLMDHMMPGMDGIEATAAIRAWEESRGGEKVPVIALTANAIFGMKEMFLSKGFNDYISKPIEIAKLDEMMARWIPAEKQIKSGKGIQRKNFSGETKIVIPGVDTQKGINMTGGTEAGYLKVLARFYKDVRERLTLLREPPEKTALPLFITQVHAIKSAAGTIGAAEVSADAAALETAGNGALAGGAGDTAAIRERLPPFTEKLAALMAGIGAALEVPAAPEEAAAGAEPNPELLPLLRELAESLQAKKMTAIDRVLEELNQRSLDVKTREALDAVSDDVLMGEYGKALDTVKKFTGEQV